MDFLSPRSLTLQARRRALAPERAMAYREARGQWVRALEQRYGTDRLPQQTLDDIDDMLLTGAQTGVPIKTIDIDAYRRTYDEYRIEEFATAHRQREEAKRRVAAEERAANPAPPFDAGTLAEILARPQPEPFRIADIQPSDASTLIIAQRKTGKTVLTLNYAHALITGEPLLGRFEVNSPVTGNVALLNFEVSAHQIGSWAHARGLPGDRLFLANMRGRRNPLDHPEDRATLAALLRAHDTETLIVDPFSRAFSGSSQNDASEVQAWLSQLEQFARQDVGARDLILTAHAGWDGSRSRGSSVLEDHFDALVYLTSTDEDDGTRYFRARGRDVEVGEDAMGFDRPTQRQWLTGTGSRRTSKGSQYLETALGNVAEFLAKSPGTSGEGIRAALIGNQKLTTAAVKLGVERGLFEQRKREGKGGGFSYFLAKTPTPANPG